MVKRGDLIVDDDGIYRVIYADENDCYSTSEVILTKEAFIEAYNKYIKGENDNK